MSTIDLPRRKGAQTSVSWNQIRVQGIPYQHVYVKLKPSLCLMLGRVRPKLFSNPKRTFRLDLIINIISIYCDRLSRLDTTDSKLALEELYQSRVLSQDEALRPEEVTEKMKRYIYPVRVCYHGQPTQWSTSNR